MRVRLMLLLCGAASLAACATPPPRVDTFSGLEDSLAPDVDREVYKGMTVAVIPSENTRRTREYLIKQTGALHGRTIDPAQIEAVAAGLLPVFEEHFHRAVPAGSPTQARTSGVDVTVVVDVFTKAPASIFNKARFGVEAYFLDRDEKIVAEVKSSMELKPSGLGVAAVNRAIRDSYERGKREFAKALFASDKLRAYAERFPAPAGGADARPSARAPLPRRGIVSDVDEPGFALPDDPKKFALVIGVENYRNLPAADFAERDADAVHAHLRAAGYPERNIIKLAGERATISDMRKYIEEWLPRNIRSDSTLFFYYSGHGAPNPTSGEAYLVPWDGDSKFLKTTGYPLKRLYASLGALKAHAVFAALDACFSGAGGRSVLAKGARPLVMKVDTGLAGGQDITLLAASSGDEITGSLESQGHGLFTYYLLKGLNGEARDARGAITVQRLYDYLSPLVRDEARRDNREQAPILAGPGRNRLLLRLR